MHWLSQLLLQINALQSGAPISNSNCNANFCFLSLQNGNELTFCLNVTRYLGGGGAGHAVFVKKAFFSQKLGL